MKEEEEEEGEAGFTFSGVYHFYPLLPPPLLPQAEMSGVKWKPGWSFVELAKGVLGPPSILPLLHITDSFSIPSLPHPHPL